MKKNINLLFAIVLIATIVLTGCNSQNNPTEESDETAASSIVETEPETEEPTEYTSVEKTAEDYVSTCREYIAHYRSAMILAGGNENSSETTICRLPQLNTDLKAASSINQEIHNNFDKTFDEYTTIDEQFIPADWIDYRCYLNSSVLSLIIERRTTNTPNSFFYVYNIDVISGEQLYNDDIINCSSVSSDKANELLKDEIEEIYADVQGEWVTDDMLKNAKNKTLSSEYLDKVSMYLNEDGKLCAAYRYVWFAGAGDYGDICILDAEKTESAHPSKIEKETDTVAATEKPSEVSSVTFDITEADVKVGSAIYVTCTSGHNLDNGTIKTSAGDYSKCFKIVILSDHFNISAKQEGSETFTFTSENGDVGTFTLNAVMS